MRPYKGKRKGNNEWVYGWAFPIEERAFLITGSVTIFCREGAVPVVTDDKVVEVVPATVSQSTGLKDKNGKEIYEGDIIQHNVPKKTKDNTYNLNESVVKTRTVEWGTFVRCGFNVMSCTQHIYEIIGNIHDNPELLEDNNG